MIEQLNDGRNLGLNTKSRRERTQSIEELFSDLLTDASTFDPDMKMRFVEAFFYAGQRDIRQAMMDFEALEDADRLVAGYLLRSLARKAGAGLPERRSKEAGVRARKAPHPKRRNATTLPEAG